MIVWYISSGEHDFIGEFYTDLDEMAEGEGFQIVTWDAINKEKRDKRAKKGEDYENSGTVILKSINIDRVSVIDPQIQLKGTFTNYVVVKFCPFFTTYLYSRVLKL